MSSARILARLRTLAVLTSAFMSVSLDSPRIFEPRSCPSDIVSKNELFCQEEWTRPMNSGHKTAHDSKFVFNTYSQCHDLCQATANKLTDDSVSEPLGNIHQQNENKRIKMICLNESLFTSSAFTKKYNRPNLVPVRRPYVALFWLEWSHTQFSQSQLWDMCSCELTVSCAPITWK